MILLDIFGWWTDLAGFEKVFWGIALIFSFFFLVQTVFFFASGSDGESMGDADLSVDGDGGVAQGFFTIKNMLAFFTVFGWTGLAMIKGGASKPVVIIVALLAGLGTMFIMVALFRGVNRLRQSGTLQIKNAIGTVAETYLVIPAARGGIGKIHIRVQGTLRELPAVTDDIETISTGKLVKVTGVVNDQLLLVTSHFTS